MKNKDQNGFIQHLAPRLLQLRSNSYLPKTEDSELSAGFIPLLITLFVVLAAIIWVAYKHVSSVQK